MHLTSNLNELVSSFAGLAVLGTVLGVVIRAWPNIKALIVSCWSIGVINIKLDGEETAKTVVTYLLFIKMLNFSLDSYKKI